MKFLVWEKNEVVEKEAASSDDLGLRYRHFVSYTGDVENLKKLVRPEQAIGVFESMGGKGLAGYGVYVKQ